MALLARILKAGLNRAPARRVWDPARARAEEDKGAVLPGAPRTHGRAEGPRSLTAMPGPGTLANLVEFFCQDGFSRIHEIQVAARTGPDGGARPGGLRF